MFILVLLLWNPLTEYALAGHVSLSVIPGAGQPIIIGQKVILTCRVNRSNRELATLFQHKDSLVSENCAAYNVSKHHVECSHDSSDSSGKVSVYKLHIKSIDWSDRGNWSCLESDTMVTVNLDVFAPHQLSKMKVKSLAKRPADKAKAASTSGGEQKEPANVKIVSLPPHQTGFGTRTNPYDLRSGLGLELKCSTSCGYPPADVKWLFFNTTSTPDKSLFQPPVVTSTECQRSLNSIGQSQTSSGVRFFCSSIGGLVGLKKVQCVSSLSTPPQSSSVKKSSYYHPLLPTMSREVYVLCPGGELQLALTGGEVVGIAVGGAIALVWSIVACLLLRRRSKESRLAAFPNYIQGQRV